MFLHRGKRIMTIAFACALFQSIFVSCADDLFPNFVVQNSYLSDGKAVVEFSAPIDQSSAKENFIFAQDDAQMDGTLSFCGNSLIFEPFQKICENHCYKARVCCGARDIVGNVLQYDYSNSFYTKSDLTNPLALGARQGNGFIEIDFNKPVDEKSFLESCSIQPQKEFFLEWTNQNKTARLVFKGELKEKTLYSLKIASGLKDAVNNKMQNDFLWSWTHCPSALDLAYNLYGYRADSGERVLIGQTFEGADLSKGIEIEFNKPFDADSAMGAISVAPRLSILVEPRLDQTGGTCKSAAIKFESLPKWSEEIILFVDIKENQRSVLIKNNAERLRPPKLEFLALKVGQEVFVLEQKNAFANISFNTTDFPENEEKALPLLFVYSISQNSNCVDRLSAMEATSVQTNSCASVVLRTMDALLEAELLSQQEFAQSADFAQKVQELKAQNLKLCAAKFGAAFKNRLQNGDPARGILEFKASAKLCDDQKNFMEEGAAFACNKN